MFSSLLGLILLIIFDFILFEYVKNIKNQHRLIGSFFLFLLLNYFIDSLLFMILGGLFCAILVFRDLKE